VGEAMKGGAYVDQRGTQADRGNATNAATP